MAGKRKVFEQALRDAHNYAWDARWDAAIEAYQRALGEFPDDAGVRNHLAQAYVSCGRVGDALAEYQKISSLTPADPLPVARCGAILASQGQVADAVQSFQRAAELSQAEGRLAQAVELLETAAKLTPDDAETRRRLAELYLLVENRSAASMQHMAMARIAQQHGDREAVIHALQRALEVDPQNGEARWGLERLLREEQGATHSRPPSRVQALLQGKGEEPATPAGASPADRARERALSQLADVVFGGSEASSEAAMPDQVVAAGGAGDEAHALIAQAIDRQTRGEVQEAISRYEQALRSGADYAAIHFNLGLLYQRGRQYAKAMDHFSVSAADPEYRLGSYYAMGDCCRTQGEVGDALRHYTEVLKIVDVEGAGYDQADALLKRYEALEGSGEDSGDHHRALVLMSSLVAFLSSQDWEERVMRARRRLDDASQGEAVISMMDVLEMPDSDVVLSVLESSQEYLDQGMYLAAAEECYRAISVAPGYLPLHLRLADICLAQGRAEEAIAKYRTVAETFVHRNQPEQAVRTYQRMVDLMPVDIGVRENLAGLLSDMGDVDGALEHYLAMGDACYRMAELGRAVHTYDRALALARSSSSPQQWETRILHLLGDLYVQNVEWDKARRIYRRLLTLSPEDTKARLRLIDLHFKLEDRDAALQELAALAEGGSPVVDGDDEMVWLLRDIAQSHPEDAEVRACWAGVFERMGMREDAIAELQGLSELLLDAGMHEEVVEAVRKLAELDPGRAQEYQQLLGRLPGARPTGD